MAEVSRDYPLEWAYAYGEPGCQGTIRSAPQDFRVDEVLGYEPDGSGNHVLLHIRKTNTNTEWLARRLAEFAAVPPREVGYAGLKDRHAVTSQYFTVHLGGQPEPDWLQLNGNEIEVLDVTRHGRKLRRGGLQENRFAITVRNLQGDCGELESRLRELQVGGVPNYFGSQRFGRDGNNLRMAERLFRGEVEEGDRHVRGLYLSAARSWLFNRVLSMRVSEGSWRSALPGEALLQPHSRSALTLRVISEEIRGRIAKGYLQPSAPLWGRGASGAQGEVLALEQGVLAEEGTFMRGLEAAGLEQERRALGMQVKGLEWQWQGSDVLQLRFALPPGCYATAVLRELVRVEEALQAVTA